MDDSNKSREELLCELRLLRRSSQACEVSLGERRRIESALLERVKELNCLYGITRLAQNADKPQAELATDIAALICASWQYPESACARISIDGSEYATGNFQNSRWRQASTILVQGVPAGEVEVFYLTEHPQADEGPFLKEERHLIDAVADLVGRIVTQRRVERQMRVLSRELIMAQENERQRIARELHDNLTQDLCLARGVLEQVLSGQPVNEEMSPLARQAAERLGAAIESIRNLAHTLLPVGLMELGLVNTLLHHCEEYSLHHGIEVELFADGMESIKLCFETQINLYRLIQESMTNTRKHAAASRIVIRFLASYPDLIVLIEDDGRGAVMEACFAKAGRERRMGLWSMRERVRFLGGKIGFQSRPGAGMHVRVEIPIDRNRRDDQAHSDR